MSRRRGKQQRDGPLQGHFKQGRVFRPPLLAYENTQPNDWVKEDLPDLLWVVLLVAHDGADGLIRFRTLQESLISRIGMEQLDDSGVRFDGRLTSIDCIDPEARQDVLDVLDMRRDVVPDELIALLRLYSDVPGSWLLVDPYRDEHLEVTGDDALDDLARSIVAVAGDGHSNALVKCAPISWRMLNGKMSMGASEIELLKDYPTNEATRSLADSILRSSFAAFKAAEIHGDPDLLPAMVGWARSFWGQNWHLSGCVPEEELDAAWADGHETEGAGHHGGDRLDQLDDDEDTGTLGDPAVAQVEDLYARFMRRALDPDMDVDLYAPAKHEVVCGLISRASRGTHATLRAPHLWSGEHGMGTIRMLVESMITLTWMATQDEAIYDRYQSYGRGKQKLMKRNMETIAADLGEATPELLTAALGQLDEKVGGAWGQEFQEVSLDATFAGISLRQMASDCGQEDLYRYLFQTASGVTHGEWWAIEDYAMQRCMNPLHLFHRVPSQEVQFPITPHFAGVLITHLKELMTVGLRTLGRLPAPEAPGAGAT